MKLQRPGHREGSKAWRPGAADHPSTAEKPESPVANLLRASRLRCGQELPAIAQALRIRRSYLEALEEGRFSDLPGATYAVGFVRTYAEHLGLDGEEVVRRFKAEASGIHRSISLVFPSPVTEGGKPGGALLLIGVLLAGLAYGGWYVLSTRDQTVAELVPNLPERFAALVENVRSSVSGPAKEGDASGSERIPTSLPSAAADSTVRAKTAPPVPAPAPIAQTPAVVPPVSSARETPPPPAAAPPPTPPAAELPPPPAAAPPVAVAAAPAAPPAVSESPVSLSRAEAAPPPAPRSPAPEAARSQPPATESRASLVPPVAAVPPATVPPAPPAIPSASTDTADRQVAGLVETSDTPADGLNANAGSGGTPRIVVRARTDSWIQIRDDVGNQLLLTRLMRAGDTYEVPNRSGLKLLTGNAGALDILVDGEMTPSLGPVGAVRRDISLNAELLRSGAAARP